MLHNLTFDLTKQTAKPTDVAAISNRLINKVEVSIETFAEYVAQPNGYTWCPAVFNGKRNNANWLSQSVFALDFDSGVSPDEVIKTLTDYSITPNVLYTSFSDTPELRKFRVVIFVDAVVNDAKTAKFIQLNLMRLLPMADKACKDYARLFYGGKDCLHLDTKVNSLANLVDVLNTVAVANDKMQVRGVCNIAEISSSYNNIIEGGESCKTHNSLETAQLKMGEISSSYNNIIEGGKNPDFQDMVKNFDFKLAAEEVQIFKDFIDGEWLTHPQLFGLATNLVWIEGGLKLMKETMDRVGKYNANNYAIIPYVRKMKYNPMNLSNFSPYDELHTNIITSAHAVRGAVEVLESTPRLSLAEAEIMLETALNNALAGDKGIYIIKCPTGIGKTRLLESIKATIALPTNQLKEEVYNRVTIDKVMTPSLPTLTDEALKKQVDYLYSVGLQKLATILLAKTAKQKHRDSAALAAYFNQLAKATTAKCAVITTHSRALYTEFNSDTVIFDECPLDTLLPMGEFDLRDLTTLIGQPDLFNHKADFIAIRAALENTSCGTIEQTKLTVIEDLVAFTAAVASQELSSDIIGFLNSDFFIRNKHNPNKFNFIKRKEFPDKKIIIMSATAPVEIYKQLYKDNLTVSDITNVEHVGRLIQHTGRSFSRESISKLSNEQLEKMIDTSKPTITFKTAVGRIRNSVKTIYFGNVAGYDSLKGQDINVVGTPHLNNTAYFLLAAVLGIKLSLEDTAKEIGFREVIFNGIKFRFNTYENKQLSKIQMSLIEAQLVQAVGRGRILREDCTTHLYSNLPLNFATQFVK